MEIDVATLNFDLTPRVAEYADRRVFAACIKVGGALEAAFVRLWEVNAGRGGKNKACRIRARLPGRTTVVAEAIDPDLYNAIDRASARFRRALHRHTHEQKPPAWEHPPSIETNAVQYIFLMMQARQDQAFPGADSN